MSRVSLYLLVPGLLDRTRRWAKDFGSLPRFAGVETLLARAHKAAVPADGVDATLCALFGLVASGDLDLPLGALRRLGFGRGPDQAVWLCADPVNLKADVASVYLRDSGSLAVTQSEARRLGEMFSTHFAGDGLTLEMTSPAYWHLRLPATTRITTHAQRQVMGQAIETHLPAGADAARWRSLLNETQMLFHAADINRLRERRGQPMVNGLWVSGVGRLPGRERLSGPIDAVWSDDPLAQGLGRLAEIDAGPLPAMLGDVLADTTRNAHLVTLEQALPSARYDDFSAWCAAVTHLDDAWFAPAAQALTQGRINACHVYDCAGRRYSVNRARQWRLWRRARSLDTFADI